MTGWKTTDKVQMADQPLRVTRVLAARYPVSLAQGRPRVLAILLMFWLTGNYKVLKRENALSIWIWGNSAALLFPSVQETVS